MSLLGAGCAERGIVLEDDEGKAPGASCLRVHLQVDVLDLAVLTEILLDIGVTRLLGQTAHEKLAIILVHGHGWICSR